MQPMISLIIILLPLVIQVKSFPLINKNDFDLRVLVNFAKRTETLRRKVEISRYSEDLEALNELNNNGINEEDGTIRIFIPTNRDRFDSWGG